MSVCDDAAGARGVDDAEAGGACGGAGGHVQRAGRGKHAVGVCDDGAGARGGFEEGAGGAAGGHDERAGRGKHAVGVCDDGAGAWGGWRARSRKI